MAEDRRATEDRRARLADRVAGALVLLLGAAQAAVAMRQGSMNEDGISYLDVGAAWLRGDWSPAINAVWNPLYALLISPANLAAVPMDLRFAVVQGINFVIFAGAFLAFRVMWRELGHAAGRHADAASASDPVPSAAWVLVGHAVFAWMALNLIEIWSVTPDMLMAGLVFGSVGLLLRCAHRPSRSTAFLFGLLLGASYLAKTVMFPLGFVTLGVAGIAWAFARRRQGVPSTHRHPADPPPADPSPAGLAAIAAAGFLCLVLPWVTAISLQQGEATFGESGNLTYLRYVNGVSYPFWESGGSAVGEPVHPARLVARDPDIWAFGRQGVGGTYPPSFDPSYWYEGVSPRIDLRRTLDEMAANLAFTFDLVTRRLGLPVGALLVLLLLSRGPTTRAGGGKPSIESSAAGASAVAVLGGAGIVLYLPVLAEGRYLGVWLVLAFGGLLALVRVPVDRGGAAAGRAAGFVMVAGLALQILAFNLAGAARVAGLDVSPSGGLGLGDAASSAEPPPATGSSADHVDVARALIASGVAPGTPVGVIGYAFDSYWAKLAEVKIVAEMPAEQRLYWNADATRRADLQQAFAESGAAIIVAEAPPDPLPPGWEPLGDTGLAVRVIDALEPRPGRTQRTSGATGVASEVRSALQPREIT